MAYYTEHSRERIDETTARWKSACLLDNESLVFDGRQGVWTEANILDLRARFNDNQLEGDAGGGTFATKWDIQLHGASDDVRLLAAELLLIHFLFASSVKKPKKLEVIGRTLAGTGIELPSDSPVVAALCVGGAFDGRDATPCALKAAFRPRRSNVLRAARRPCSLH